MANLFRNSETQISSPTEGQGWIKPSTGGVYFYINDGWRPLLSGSEQELRSFVTIFINNIDRTEDITRLKIKDNLTNKVDTCTFTVDSDGDYTPQEGEEVEIYRQDTKIYGGNIIITTQADRAEGIYSYKYKVKCVDYSHKLKKKRVIESYTSQTAGYIIKDIVDEYATELSYDNVEDGVTVNFIQFNYKTAYQCIKEICNLTGYDFYVDAKKDIHFFENTTNSAPYDITDTSSTSGNYRNLQVKVDKSQIKNVVTIQGGYFFSEDFNDIIEVADSSQTTWSLSYEPYVPSSGSIEIYVSTDGGSTYTQKTLGTDNLADSGFDFLINQKEKNINQLDYDTSEDDLIKVVYAYKVPILTEDKNQDSIEAMRLLEGGDGEYEYHETDTEIETISAAHDKANAILNKDSNPRVEGSFITKDTGYRSGQILYINTFGYDNEYVIQSVTTNWREREYLEYKVKFASNLLGLTEFLTNIIEQGRDVIVREGETLHKLETTNDEELEIADEDSPQTDVGLPYEWGPGGDRQAVWEDKEEKLEDTTFIWG